MKVEAAKGNQPTATVIQGGKVSARTMSGCLLTPSRTTTKVGSPGWSLFSTEGTLHWRPDMMPRGGCHLMVPASDAHGSLTPCAGPVDAPTVQLLCGHRLCTSCSPGGRCLLCEMRATVEVAAAARHVAIKLLSEDLEERPWKAKCRYRCSSAWRWRWQRQRQRQLDGVLAGGRGRGRC